MLLLPCSDVASISYSRKALCISLRAFISPLLGCRFYRNLPWLYSSMRWKKHSSLEKQMYNSPNFRNYCWNSACAQFRESKSLGSWCLHVSQVPELPFQSMKIQSIEPALFNSVKKKGELNALWMSVTVRTVLRTVLITHRCICPASSAGLVHLGDCSQLNLQDQPFSCVLMKMSFFLLLLAISLDDMLVRVHFRAPLTTPAFDIF